MTKDEYEDFVLRYKGCGACFPMYHTLSRFEKMWFTAIQKDVADLEAQIEQMKCCYNCSKWNEGLLLCNDSTVRVTTYADYCCEDWEIKEK